MAMNGRMPAFGKVAVVAVVGDEDGAHHCHAETFQALNDVGLTIPANAGAYWVGEAMGDVNYVDLKKMPRKWKRRSPCWLQTQRISHPCSKNALPRAEKNNCVSHMFFFEG
jgi:hypothetical protein